jgi:hypothetical protein
VASRVLFCLIALSTLTARCLGANTDAAWTNLRRVAKAGYYEVFSRNHEGMISGRIKQVSDRSIVIKQGINGEDAAVKILRQDVIQITDHTAGLLYSGRNTWKEVVSLAGLQMQGFNVGKGQFSVVTKSGARYLSRSLNVTASGIKVATHKGSEETIPKDQVATVDYIRAAPWTESAEWSYQEFGPLSVVNPAYWPDMVHANGKVVVPVYDSSLPEDDTQCKYCD